MVLHCPVCTLRLTVRDDLPLEHWPTHCPICATENRSSKLAAEPLEHLKPAPPKSPAPAAPPKPPDAPPKSPASAAPPKPPDAPAVNAPRGPVIRLGAEHAPLRELDSAEGDVIDAGFVDARCGRCGTPYWLRTARLPRLVTIECSRCGATFGLDLVEGEPTTDAQVATPSTPPFRPAAGFVGVTGARLARRLLERGRRVPLDVALGLVDRLLEATVPLAPGHRFWLTFTGPHAIGVDANGAFVVLTDSSVPLPSGGALHEDWVVDRLDAGYRAEVLQRASVWAVARALRWLLDPFPTNAEGPFLPVERPFQHPQLPAALKRLLERILAGDLSSPATVDELREALRAKTPASNERLASVCFAAGLDVATGQVVPAQWSGGALEVHSDRLLERAAPLDSFPADPNARLEDTDDFPPTRTLELQLVLGADILRRVPVTRQTLPERVSLPYGLLLREGTRLELRLVHPESVSATTRFEGVVGENGYVHLALDATSRAEVQPLLRSVDPDAPLRKRLPRWRALTFPFRLREAGDSALWRWLGLFFWVVAVALIVSLPVALLLALLWGVGVVSPSTALWAWLTFVGVVTVGIIVSLSVLKNSR